MLPKDNLVKHGNDLQVWDLHFQVESLEKVNFLFYQDAPNYFWEERIEGDARNKINLIYSKEPMHQNRMQTNHCTYITIEPT